MFGSDTFYDLFEIDASDIWSYERNRFYNSDQSDCASTKNTRYYQATFVSK